MELNDSNRVFIDVDVDRERLLRIDSFDREFVDAKKVLFHRNTPGKNLDERGLLSPLLEQGNRFMLKGMLWNLADCQEKHSIQEFPDSGSNASLVLKFGSESVGYML